MKSRYYLQIDILKALAIISVIIMHSYDKIATIATNSNSNSTLAIANPQTTISILQFNHITLFSIFESLKIFTLWQAVPIFFVLIGITWGMSFKRHNHNNLKEMYSLYYLKNRFKRLYLPYIYIFIISIIIGCLILITYNSNIFSNLSLINVMGYLPFKDPGYGSYFITLVFEIIFIFPLIYISYTKNPKLTIISVIFIDLLYQLFAFYFNHFYYDINVIRIISALLIGLWISDQDFYLDKSLNITGKLQKFILNYKLFIILSLIGICYLGLWYFLYRGYISSSFYPIPYLNSTLNIFGSQNILSFVYAGFLIVLGLIIFPNKSKNKIITKIALIGKASYHIFLIQMLYFSIFSFYYLSPIINKISIILGDVTLCVILGIVFYYLEKNIFS